jgi:hypothetical protein
VIRIDVDTSDVERELDRLARGPGADGTTMRLESTFLRAFLGTQGVVHVRTGSLKGSGRVSTNFGGSQWEGTMNYGGPSPGFPHDPVKYAKPELARHGTHNFYAPAYEDVHGPDTPFGQAVMGFLKGDEG